MVVYTHEVEGPRPATGNTPAAGPVLCSKDFKDGPPTVKGVNTLLDLFESSANKNSDLPCLGHRPKQADGSAGPFSWLTYKETLEKTAAVGSALHAQELKAGDKIGVFGTNSPQWMIAMQACNRMSYVCVPLYDSLGENAIEYIVGHAELSCVFAGADKLKQLTAALSHESLLSFVRTVVYWGNAAPESVQALKALKVAVFGFDEFEKLGAAQLVPAVRPKPEDLSTIMYTSGTTGDPKGVMITHKAIVMRVASLKAYCDSYGFHFGTGDVMLSYLPLAHIFGRTAEELQLLCGGAIGYWQGDITKLVDDIAELKPTLFHGVPRVFDRIYSAVTAKIMSSGCLKAFLYNWGFNRKLAALNGGAKHDKAAPFFDKLVFSKVKERLGGRVKVIVSGGAPIAKHVEEFLKVTMCCPVVQGYGLTETCASGGISIPDAAGQTGTCGPPQPDMQIRLEAVPEMHYSPLDNPPRGELLLRSPVNFVGYYKSPEQTAEVLEKDGWFHTGDVAELTADGSIKIIDRKKNMFKLSQGEYVAVEKLENCYKLDKFVDQIWVYGNSLEAFLVAVVVPNRAALTAAAAAEGIKGDFVDVCASDKAKDIVLKSLQATGKAGNLKGFEIIKAVHLDVEPWDIPSGLLTPTFKLKRPQLRSKYQTTIDAMYAATKASLK